MKQKWTQVLGLASLLCRLALPRAGPGPELAKAPCSCGAWSGRRSQRGLRAGPRQPQDIFVECCSGIPRRGHPHLSLGQLWFPCSSLQSGEGG